MKNTKTIAAVFPRESKKRNPAMTTSTITLEEKETIHICSGKYRVVIDSTIKTNTKLRLV